MSLEVTCPHCGHRSTGPDEIAGKDAQCPNCKKVFLVPVLHVQPVEHYPGAELFD